jgi:hypothetical protein
MYIYRIVRMQASIYAHRLQYMHLRNPAIIVHLYGCLNHLTTCCTPTPSLKGTVQRDLRGGQKWYQLIGLPLSYQRFTLDFNFIRPPS